jgi:hypothetical protein
MSTIDGKMDEAYKEKINVALEILRIPNASGHLIEAAELVLMKFLKGV